MKKRFIAIFTAAVLIAVLGGCGSDQQGEQEASSTITEDEGADDQALEESNESSYEEADMTEDASEPESYEEDSAEPAVEAPELTYKMAPLSVKAEPSEYGYTYSTYAISVDQVGFTFWDVSVYDKKTGKLCDWEDDYHWSGYPGKVCVEEKAHYTYEFTDGWFDYWATDRSTYVITIEHGGDVLGPEDVQIVAEMEYQGQSAGEYTFEVNADPEEIPVNESEIVHGFNLLKLNGQYFIPEINSSASGGGTYDYDNNTWADGFSYNFIHVGDGDYRAEDFDGCFYPVQWDDAQKTFVPYEVPDGYDIDVSINKDGDNLVVFMGLRTDMDNEVPFELIENIVPAYDGGGEGFYTFCWA